MKQFLAIISCLTALYVCFPSQAATQPQQHKFLQYLHNVRKRAAAKGVSATTLNRYLSDIPTPAVNNVKHTLSTQKQTAVRSLSVTHFLQRFVTRKLILKSRERYHQYQQLLKQIQQRYQVQPQYIIAIWGIESNFGKHVGTTNLVHALINLGFAHPNSDFYQNQVIDGLMMLDKHYRIPQQLKSTFDAGMGQPQFEPSTYLMFAVDFDKNGFKDIWTSVPDALASIGNFLHQNHWRGDQGWGFAVKPPSDAAAKLASLKDYYLMQRWIMLGITPRNQNIQMNKEAKAALLIPAEDGREHAYLVLHNFKTLMRWNNSIMESLAIGTIADKINAPAK